MVLSRIPDEFWRLTRTMSSDAVRVFIDVLTYTQGQPSDLLVEKVDVARGTYVTGPVLADAINELVALGWWHDRRTHWYVGGPDAIASLQYTREQADHHAARNRERQRRHREKRRDGSPLSAPTPNQTKPNHMDSVTNAVTNAVTDGQGDVSRDVSRGRERDADVMQADDVTDLVARLDRPASGEAS